MSFFPAFDMLPSDSTGKESACNAGDTGDMDLTHGSGRSPGGGNGNLFRYSCLKNPQDKGAWWDIVWGHKELGAMTKHSTKPCRTIRLFPWSFSVSGLTYRPTLSITIPLMIVNLLGANYSLVSFYFAHLQTLCNWNIFNIFTYLPFLFLLWAFVHLKCS